MSLIAGAIPPLIVFYPRLQLTENAPVAAVGERWVFAVIFIEGKICTKWMQWIDHDGFLKCVTTWSLGNACVLQEATVRNGGNVRLFQLYNIHENTCSVVQLLSVCEYYHRHDCRRVISFITNRWFLFDIVFYGNGLFAATLIDIAGVAGEAEGEAALRANIAFNIGYIFHKAVPLCVKEIQKGDVSKEKGQTFRMH